MKLIRLTHANFGTPIEVSAENIFYIYYSEAHKAVHVVAPGGAYFPAKETLDEVKARIQGEDNGPN